jgi:antitoxin (DNA-binding transcriptional repressor) of toxin-antitoxin stability system
MSTITMLELRRESAAVLSRLSRGERLILSHRGKPVARLEPVGRGEPTAPDTDPFLNVGARAVSAPKGSTDHLQIDAILYGKR